MNIFQKYRHLLGIRGLSWEWEQGVSDSTFISPQMYKRCRFWRNKTLKMLLTYEPLLLLYYTESYAPKTGSFEKCKQYISDSMYDIYKSISTNCNLFISQPSNCFANPLCIFTFCCYYQIAKLGFFWSPLPLINVPTSPNFRYSTHPGRAAESCRLSHPYILLQF